MRRVGMLLVLAALPVLAGCWPNGSKGAGKRPEEGLLGDGGGPLVPVKTGRQLVVLDPLEWSGKYLEVNGLSVERGEGSVLVPLDDAERTAEALAGAILALRRRMAIIAENMANAETTRLPGAEAGGKPQPYRRKVLNVTGTGSLEVAIDNSAFRRAYRPSNPDADKDGRVTLPNVYVEVEQAEWRSSAREYEALRLALAAASGKYVAPPAALLPVPSAPPAAEEKPAPAVPAVEPKPVPVKAE